ncbi:hypothetical protein [Lysobacter sp. cf310]|uniref:hypothetical protein n=1 Tax=Lysobacter sp. cf310 TaxID=1761790 RepID=UPI0008E778D5|nr:hypothetical protein [Lysobacter sp. cf310]SFK66867.1 hypothetical protein SAMN04487938_1523 [Lysobacter sp. cf310]
MKILATAVLAAAMLSACGANPSMQGHWAVDIDATVAEARRHGRSEREIAFLRELYGRGLLEITDDALVMRVVGVPDAVARNYRELERDGDCHRLQVQGSAPSHRYCLRDGRLIVDDPGAMLSLVFKRQ